MNPKKANVELKKKIIDLNETYTLGLSAKELMKTAYFKKLEELYRKEIKAFYEIKKFTPYSELREAHHYTTSNGAVKTISGAEYFDKAVRQEIAIEQKKDFLDMIYNDANAGDEAEKDLVEYKKKLNK